MLKHMLNKFAERPADTLGGAPITEGLAFSARPLTDEAGSVTRDVWMRKNERS